MGFGGISESLVEFGGIPRLVESGRFLGYVDIGRNLRLIDPSRLSRFQFRV